MGEALHARMRALIPADREPITPFVDRVRELFADDPQVKIPEIYRDWSTTRVLTMELVGGIKITEKQQIEDAGLDPAAVDDVVTAQREAPAA